MEKKRSAAEMFMEQAQKIADEDEELEMQEESMPQMQAYANVAPAASAGPGGGLSMNAPISNRETQRRQYAKKSPPVVFNTMKTSEDLQLEKEPIKARITGQWFWKRVIVPPNAYVVHTRINRRQPVTIGLGISFRYNPNTDAYLIVPSAMQTIGVVANCISKEKQGINILAYVQWQIQDFAIAYKKLDFSDPRDPLGIVNAQLREQAEAAVKDKIATMPVEEVLTDKEPIIQELTSRLKSVAEGQGSDNEGLGIKISTVQIREAIVSSSALWEDLQSPFRNEQKKKAEISSLEMENEIHRKQQDSRRQREMDEAQTTQDIELARQKKETEITQSRLREESQRFQGEQNSLRERLSLEEETQKLQNESRQRLSRQEEELRLKDIEAKTLLVSKESELELLEQKQRGEIDKSKQNIELSYRKTEEEHELKAEEARARIELELEALRAKIDRERQEIKNLLSREMILSQLIQELPKIAAEMPQVKELKILASGPTDPALDSLTTFVAKILSVLEPLGLGSLLPKPQD